MGTGLDILYAAGLTVSAPLWGAKLLTTGKWRTDWSGRFGHVPTDKQPITAGRAEGGGGHLILHAVSVGEVNALQGLVNLLRQQHRNWRITVSATTNTGYARAVELYAEHCVVVRFPLDFTCSVGRFLDALKPDLIALVELEVWPNFMQACTQRNLPVCVINGRLSQRSYQRYRIIGGLLHASFASLSAAAVQTQAYADRFVGMGVPRERVQVLDSMKWDNAVIADDVPGTAELAEAMGINRSKPLIVAGSTGPGEEAFLLEQCPPGTQLLVAPRKPERFEEAYRALASSGESVVRRKFKQHNTEARLFLLDTLGELKAAYALANIAVVGRSFLGLYGSDPTEPIALGKPTLIGPHHSDFQDMIDAFAAEQGILVTERPGEAISHLLQQPERAAKMAQRGRAVILSRQGATQRHAELLTHLVHAGTLES